MHSEIVNNMVDCRKTNPGFQVKVSVSQKVLWKINIMVHQYFDPIIV